MTYKLRMDQRRPQLLEAVQQQGLVDRGHLERNPGCRTHDEVLGCDHLGHHHHLLLLRCSSDATSFGQ